MLTFGSACSGIEAASVAWLPLGWRALWLAEVDKDASALLAYHYPDVPNLGDMTGIPALIDLGEIEAPDVFVAGTPCQGFSLAGLRGGMSDPRGRLTLTYVEIVNAIDRKRRARGEPPVICVWENVPGALSMDDNSFGAFLAALAGDDQALEPGERPATGKNSQFWVWDRKKQQHRPKWPVSGVIAGPERSVAWIVRDAQYYGLAQRRRRVFVVASAREDFDPGEVLLELDRVRRDIAPRRETGEDVTHALAPCLTGSGRGIERTGDTRGQDPVVAVVGNDRIEAAAARLLSFGQYEIDDVSSTLQSRDYKDATDLVISFTAKVFGGDASIDLSPTLRAGPHSSSHANGGVMPAVAYSIMPMNSGKDFKARETDISQPLMAAGPVGGNQGGDYIVQPVTRPVQGPEPLVLPFDTTQITSKTNRSQPRAGDTDHPLAASAHAPAVCVTGSVTHSLTAEGFDASEDGTGRGNPIVVHGSQNPITQDDLALPLQRNNGLENDILEPGQMAVRRLMPIECERLQGFPDGYTRIPVRRYKKPSITKSRPEDYWELIDGEWWLMTADSVRYKQLGNSMPVPVMFWLGQRITLNVIQHRFEGAIG